MKKKLLCAFFSLNSSLLMHLISVVKFNSINRKLHSENLKSKMKTSDQKVALRVIYHRT